MTAPGIGLRMANIEPAAVGGIRPLSDCLSSITIFAGIRFRTITVTTITIIITGITVVAAPEEVITTAEITMVAITMEATTAVRRLRRRQAVIR